MQYEILSRTISASAAKTSRSVTRTVVLAIMAGAFVALGGALALYLGSGFPDIAASNPGIAKLFSALAFPVGLFLIVMFGGELFTGNNAVLMSGLLNKRVSAAKVLCNWSLVWASNFVGALLVSTFLIYAGGLLDVEPYNSAIRNIAITKASLDPLTTFVRGIGANWCVCLAVWLSFGCSTIGQKAVAVWIPVAAFVALGFEHCIANMFYLPCGIMAGAEIPVVDLASNLLFSTLGNIVGGAVFVGLLYNRLYSRSDSGHLPQ